MEYIENKKVHKKIVFIIKVISISIISVILLSIALGAFLFFQFTPAGYRITVPLRGFYQVDDNIYINKNFISDKDEVLELIYDAKKRVEVFFGEIKSRPVIIICDDEAGLQKLGAVQDMTSIVFFMVSSHILVSPKHIDIDILAHEMTHAEVHYRVNKGKIGNQFLIPTWFDEGVAMQNDYRESYNEKSWNEVTNNGEKNINLSEIDTAEDFYVSDSEDLFFRYIVSKHELKLWIDENGIDALLDLLYKVNKGESFNSLYFSKQVF